MAEPRAFTVTPCTAEDFTPVLADVVFDAFNSSSALIDAMHPENMTSAGRAKALAFLKVLGANPSQRWVKAVSTTDSSLIGVAQFAVFNDISPAGLPLAGIKGPEGNWASDDDFAWTQALYHSLVGNRNAALAHSSPNLICTRCNHCVSLVSSPTDTVQAF